MTEKIQAIRGMNDVLPEDGVLWVGYRVRDGLTDGVVSDVGRSYAILAGWTVAASVLTGWILQRRR